MKVWNLASRQGPASKYCKPEFHVADTLHTCITLSYFFIAFRSPGLSTPRQRLDRILEKIVCIL